MIFVAVWYSLGKSSTMRTGEKEKEKNADCSRLATTTIDGKEKKNKSCNTSNIDFVRVLRDHFVSVWTLQLCLLEGAKIELKKSYRHWNLFTKYKK